MKIINYNSRKYSYKLALIPFLSFHRNQKQEWNFHEVGSLVTQNIFYFLFIAICALLQRHAAFNRLL